MFTAETMREGKVLWLAAETTVSMEEQEKKEGIT